MAGTDVQVVRREYFQGACIPYGYTTTAAPPKAWKAVVDGKTVTPKLIQRVLKRCKDANRDLEYIASVLCVGDGAVERFIENENAIPRTVAEKFIRFFSSGEKLPKAKVKPPIVFVTYKRGPNTVARTPDFDAERLAERLKAERKKLGKDYKDIAREIRSQSLSIRRAEEGKILNQLGPQSIVLRLCNFYGIDLKEFENKPRIDFEKFQVMIQAAKKKKFATWVQVADAAGISERLLQDFRCYSRSRENIVYLSKEMEAVLKVLGISPKKLYVE